MVAIQAKSNKPDSQRVPVLNFVRKKGRKPGIKVADATAMQAGRQVGTHVKFSHTHAILKLMHLIALATKLPNTREIETRENL